MMRCSAGWQTWSLSVCMKCWYAAMFPGNSIRRLLRCFQKAEPVMALSCFMSPSKLAICSLRSSCSYTCGDRNEPVHCMSLDLSHILSERIRPRWITAWSPKTKCTYRMKPFRAVNCIEEMLLTVPCKLDAHLVGRNFRAQS